MFFNYLWMSFPLQPSFALTVLYCPNLVSLLLVGWQSPPCKLTIASEYSAGMKPLATFRATINSISIRNRILLITPVIHIFSHRRRSILKQVETRAPAPPHRCPERSMRTSGNELFHASYNAAFRTDLDTMEMRGRFRENLLDGAFRQFSGSLILFPFNHDAYSRFDIGSHFSVH